MADQKITIDDKRSLRKFVNEKFSQMKESQVGLTHLHQHEIPIRKEPKPWRLESYEKNPEIRKMLHDEVDRLYDKGYITEINSHTNWVSPSRMIKNKAGEWLFHVDYSKLNSSFMEWNYPIHSQWDILENIKDAHIISCIKIKEVFHQIALKPESRKYTAFIVKGRGAYAWVRMPYGLKGASASVCYVADQMKLFVSKRIKSSHPEIMVDEKLFVCLETWIVTSETPKEHEILLDCLLDVLYENGLEIDLENSQFAKESIDYMRFTIDGKGLRVSKESIQPILDYPRPQTIQEVRRFNGMVNHYRNYLPDIEKVQEPLQIFHLPKPDWKWTEKEEAAFQKSKELILNATITYIDI